MSTLHPGKGYKPVRLDDVPTGTNYTIASGYKGKDPIVIVPANNPAKSVGPIPDRSDKGHADRF